MSGQIRVDIITNEDGTNGPTIGSTGALTLPSGTTAEQPTPVAGMIRFNTETNNIEVYNGTAWGAVAGSGGLSEFLLIGA